MPLCLWGAHPRLSHYCRNQWGEQMEILSGTQDRKGEYLLSIYFLKDPVQLASLKKSILIGPFIGPLLETWKGAFPNQYFLPGSICHCSSFWAMADITSRSQSPSPFPESKDDLGILLNRQPLPVNQNWCPRWKPDSSPDSVAWFDGAGHRCYIHTMILFSF